MIRSPRTTSVALVLLMAWTSIWCCCQQAIAAPAEQPAATTCCEPKTSIASEMACDAPMNSGSDTCPFIQARESTWLQIVDVPDLRPELLASLPALFEFTPFAHTERVPLPAAPAHGPPQSPVDMRVLLLC